MIIVIITLDRKSSNIIAGPEIVTRGFVYVRESEELMDEAKSKVVQALKHCAEENIYDWTTIKVNIKDVLAQYNLEKPEQKVETLLNTIFGVQSTLPA